MVVFILEHATVFAVSFSWARRDVPKVTRMPPNKQSKTKAAETNLRLRKKRFCAGGQKGNVNCIDRESKASRLEPFRLISRTAVSVI